MVASLSALHHLLSLPSVSDLEKVSVEEVPAEIARLAAILAALAVRLASTPTTPAPSTSPCLVTAQKVSEALSMPVPRVYELARTGRIPAVRVGRSVRFDLGAVRRALAD